MTLETDFVMKKGIVEYIGFLPPANIYIWLVGENLCTQGYASLMWAMSIENLSSGGLRPGKTQTSLLSYRD